MQHVIYGTSVRGCFASPRNPRAGVLAPRISECDLIPGYGLYRESQFTMRSSGWALLQYDWCPHRKEKVGHRRKTRGGDGLRSRREVQSRPSLGRTSPDNALTVDFWAAGVDSNLLWHCVTAAPANWYPDDAEKLEGGEGIPAVRSGVDDALSRVTSTTNSLQSSALVVLGHRKVSGGQEWCQLGTSQTSVEG